MEVIRGFLRAYWAWPAGRYVLMALGVVFIATIGVFRRPGLAVGIVITGIYASAATLFMWTYAEYGLAIEWALVIVIGGALAIVTAVYYAVFVRS